nr:hypothetical protein [Tanacetum cinerariifolium]
MSGLEDSTVTYTKVSSPFEGLSDIGSPRVEGPPMMPEDPYAYVVADFQALSSLDYVLGPKEPEQTPPLPEFVLEPVYPEFMPLEDEILLAEEEPLPAADSPTADSLGYIPESDLEEDPVDYLADGGDDDDDDDGLSDDEEDDDDDPPTPVWFEAEIDSLLAIPSPPPSPLSPCHTESCCTIHYILAPRSETPPSGTPPLILIPLPTSSPPLILPSTIYRVDIIEVTLLPQKRLCIALGLIYEVGESSYAPTARPTGGFKAGYGFVATLDDEIRRTPTTDETELRQRMTDFVTTVRQDTDEIYKRLDDAQGDRVLMSDSSTCCAWVHSMDASDTTHVEVMSLRTTVLAQQSKIAGDDEDPLEVQHIPRHRRRPVVVPRSCYKMAPKRTTRSTPATTTTTTTIVTDVQLKALIDQGIANALAACDVDRSQNGKDNHNSRMGMRRQAPPAREFTY